MTRIAAGLLGTAAVLLVSGTAAAQGIAITPSIGAYVPASGFNDLRDQAENIVRVEKETTFALGLAAELGWLRGSLAYASGATLNIDDPDVEGDVGEGSLLVGAADLVLRPIPRLVILQPYLLGGIGFKNASYDTDEPTDAFPEDDRDVALHVGVGLDLSLGGLGLVAEITDFISRDANDDWGVHDAFAMVGLKFRLGR